MSLKLGVIGMSEGNGHPFSWSAICNGYDARYMAESGYPIISEYLARESWPEAMVAGAKVTHVWTQDRQLSESVAQASLIEKVVEDPKEMIGQVDALLLARDDAENHLEFASKFLEKGVPIYVDKPVALSRGALNELFERESYPGQIFSCSALRFADELALSERESEEIGELNLVIATTPRSWRKYAIHAIEPALRLNGAIHDFHIKNAGSLADEGGLVTGFTKKGLQIIFLATGAGTNSQISIRYLGSYGSVEKFFVNTFSAFKRALETFIETVASPSGISQLEELEPMVKIIEAVNHGS